MTMLVTIYIPTHNRLMLLKRAIDSVREQTYSNIELIVVDDGSTDGTREFLLYAAEQKTLKAIFLEGKNGAPFARNIAIHKSSGDLITGLDDDDFFSSSTRVEDLVKKWDSLCGRAAGVFDSARVLTPHGVVYRSHKVVVNYQDLRRRNFVGNQVLAPKKFYIEAGMFDPDMPAWQDWDLWLRMSEKFGSFYNLNSASYTIDETHHFHRISQRGSEKLRAAMRKLNKKTTDITLKEKIIRLHSFSKYENAELHNYERLLLAILKLFITWG